MKYYNPSLKKYLKNRRSTLTPAEIKLWANLRNRYFMNYKCRRQHIIHNYIVDFFCHELKLIIEIDGASHDEKVYSKDVLRQSILIKLGFRILRFSEYDVKMNLDSVLQTIFNLTEEFRLSSSLTQTLSQRERGN